MAETSRSNEPVNPPFTTFNFRVELNLDGQDREGQGDDICRASFSDCDGLDMTMEIKTIREGGNNNQPIHLVGPVNYGQLTLKRGMTSTPDLWDWFEKVLQKGHWGKRAHGQVIMMAADGRTEQVRFQLTGCLPVKIKAPALSAKDGLVAIEEMQIAYEMMRIERPGA
jgi:phage tail-like protein